MDVKYHKESLEMNSPQDQESNPHIESNDDKGQKDSHQNTEPQKKPNEQPENPLKEQKQLDLAMKPSSDEGFMD